MLQYSKIIQSRDEWKHKASQRADELREHRKTKKRHQKIITELKAELGAMKQPEEGKKNL